METQRSYWLPTLILSAGLLSSSIVISRTVLQAMHIKQRDHQVTVTGSARRRIRSDLALWTCTVSVRAASIPAATTVLTAQVPRVQTWLRSQGITEQELRVEAVVTEEQHPVNEHGEAQTDRVTGYRLQQSIRVTSSNVDRIARVAEGVTALLSQNGTDAPDVLISSENPRYLYTRLGELKPILLAEAAQDARARAQLIAQRSGANIGTLMNARMGVVQVNAANETETSAEGVNDDTSIEKDALGVVHSIFSTQ